MKEYNFLKKARLTFKVLAWVILVVMVIVGLAIFITGGGAPTGAVTPQGTPIQPTPRILGIAPILMGAFYFLIFYTLSEVIALLLDIKDSCKPSATV